MNNPIPCFLADSDEARLLGAADTVSAMRAKTVEDYADNLMDDCKVLAMAELTNRDNDLYDGDLLPKLMTAIANWTGDIYDSHARMKQLHVLLAGEFQKIAEREVE